jgi:hypothetical protein
MNSPNTMRHVGSPATRAARMKSRLRNESACPRRIRVSIAQARQPDDQRHHEHAGVLQERRDHDQERQDRDDEKDVREEIDHVVDPAAAVGGEQAEGDRDRHRDHRSNKGDDERDPPAVNDLRPDVVALVGRAERILGRGGLAGQLAGFVRRVVREQRRRDRDHHDRRQEAEPEGRLWIPKQELQELWRAQPPVRRRRDGTARDRCRDRLDRAVRGDRQRVVAERGFHMGHQAVLTRGSRNT